MLSPSDYNSAVPQFTNGDYASNPINPLYVEEPTAVDYNRGVEPLQTLPAQWWNWLGNQITARFNKLNIYVKNIFNELAQLLSLANITPDGTEQSPTVGQLKTMFQTEYPKYMALLMYPVGSLYWTGKAPDDGGNPNELFGGTWVQIKGMFVFAKGDSDTLNATGGAKAVTLTIDQIPSHTHTFTGSSVTSGANNKGHTHSVTASGTVGVTTNPTFTGTEHSHTYTPAGKIASTSGGSDNKTATESAHTHGYSHTHDFRPRGTIGSISGGNDGKTAGMSAHAIIPFTTYGMGNGVRSPMVSFAKSHTSSVAYYDNNDRMYFYTTQSGSTWAITSSDNLQTRTQQSASQYTSDSHGYYTGNLEIGHTHNAYFSGSVGTTETQSSTTTGAGSAHSHTAYFTGTQATLKATAGGSISGGSYSFTGTAVTSEGESQTHTHSVTASGTNSTVGGGEEHDNMPPYIVKYCWERTA